MEKPSLLGEPTRPIRKRASSGKLNQVPVRQRNDMAQMDIFYRRKTHMLLVSNGVYVQRWRSTLIQLSDTIHDPYITKRCWNENTQKILSYRHSTSGLWSKNLKAPELLEAQNRLLASRIHYRGCAARLNHGPLTTPKASEMQFPSTRSCSRPNITW